MCTVRSSALPSEGSEGLLVEVLPQQERRLFWVSPKTSARGVGALRLRVRPRRRDTVGRVWGRIGGRRVMLFGTPGAMRQKLIALVLSGQKTATAGLFDQEYEQEHEQLEHVGEELVVVDSDDAAVAVVAVDSVEVVPFARVAWEFADAEGEGFESIEDWRSGHLRFWRGQGVAVTDDTPIVCLRFHLAESGAQ